MYQEERPMSKQTAPHVASAPGATFAFEGKGPEPGADVRARSRRLFWLLAGVGLVLNAGILYLAGSLLLAPRGLAPAPQGRIAVPYDTEETLWEPYRRWVVQEDGRNKPFDTFCRESVRAITGRERFEAVRSPVTGHELDPGRDPVAVVASWLLLYDQDPGRAAEAAGRAGCDWEHYPFILCKNTELRQLLYGEYRHGAALSEEDRRGLYVEPAVLRGSAALAELVSRAYLRRDEDGKAPLPPLERDALEVMGRLDLYDRIRGGGRVEDGREGPRAGGYQIVALDRCGKAWFSLASLRAYAGAGGQAKWDTALRQRGIDDPASYEGTAAQPFPEAQTQEILAAFAALGDAYRSGAAARFAAASGDFFDAVGRVSSRFNRYPDTDTTARELWFNRSNPFRKAWVASLLAALLLAASVLTGRRWLWAGRLSYGAGLLAGAGSLTWAVAGFYCRVSISGRPPVSNMYESIVWVAFMTAAFGLILELIYRPRVIALAAALVSTLGFVLADQLPLTFSPSIQPLEAVLRSNYWLVVHVLPIVSSYAPFALAWGLGNINLGLILYAPGRRDLIRTLSQFCYRCIQVGVLLLFLGTMLGGFWAAESWGRFWGWDPKEVWALVAFLCYVIPLHARYVGWVKDFGLAVCSVVCFSSVVMAWYGVNFVLGAGLHSYGFGSGEHAWIYLAGLLNISLVVHGALRYLHAEPVREGARG
jgi:ABC-type transport system involved in cytochrome c biogenesis permease subunit